MLYISCSAYTSCPESPNHVEQPQISFAPLLIISRFGDECRCQTHVMGKFPFLSFNNPRQASGRLFILSVYTGNTWRFLAIRQAWRMEWCCLGGFYLVYFGWLTRLCVLDSDLRCGWIVPAVRARSLSEKTGDSGCYTGPISITWVSSNLPIWCVLLSLWRTKGHYERTPVVPR